MNRLPRPVPPPAKPGELPTSPLLQWFRPDEDVELELVGACGAATRDLLEQLRRLEIFLRAGVDPPTRVLFSGPSGTGKTLTARWIARQLELPIAIVDVGNISSKWHGESQKQLAEAFTLAKGVAGAALFFDEIDAICAKREDVADGSGGAESARVTTTFFQQIDWLPPSRIVFAATNFGDDLDPALRRRLTTHIAFTTPDRAERRRMLDRWLAKVLTLAQLDELADATEGLAGAALRSAAMTAARAAIMAMPAPETAQLTLADASERDNVRRLPRRPVPESERAPNSEQLVADLLKTLDTIGAKGAAPGGKTR